MGTYCHGHAATTTCAFKTKQQALRQASKRSALLPRPGAPARCFTSTMCKAVAKSPSSSRIQTAPLGYGVLPFAGRKSTGRGCCRTGVVASAGSPYQSTRLSNTMTCLEDPETGKCRANDGNAALADNLQGAFSRSFDPAEAPTAGVLLIAWLRPYGHLKRVNTAPSLHLEC